MLDFVAHVIDDLTRGGLDATAMRTVFRAVEQHAQVFDEITRPCLSHGDLWPFNMLVARSEDGPRICAVLDADRAWWCDPLADWTAHLFRIKTTPHMLRRRAIFWEEYGPKAEGPSATLRELVYDAMHTGAIVASAKTHHQDRVLAESCDRLGRIPASLHAMLSADG